jgi:hypothetical protein
MLADQRHPTSSHAHASSAPRHRANPCECDAPTDLPWKPGGIHGFSLAQGDGRSGREAPIDRWAAGRMPQ